LVSWDEISPSTLCTLEDKWLSNHMYLSQEMQALGPQSSWRVEWGSLPIH